LILAINLILKNKKFSFFLEAHEFSELDQGLLRQAFTHSSASKKNNERLEFFGDAVLDCILSEELYQKFPAAKENYLTRLRSHLVNKQTLALLAQKLNFSEMVLLGEGERRTGGRQRDSVLADAFEAVIGAIFLSSDYLKTKNYILNIYLDLLNNLPDESELKDPKTRLQEYLQQRALPIPEYQIVEESGKPHDKTFVVEVIVKVRDSHKKIVTRSLRASGNSRRSAEQQSAQDVFELILSEKQKI